MDNLAISICVDSSAYRCSADNDGSASALISVSSSNAGSDQRRSDPSLMNRDMNIHAARWRRLLRLISYLPTREVPKMSHIAEFGWRKC